MNKLNRWLLLNYPMIWNMRLHYVLPVLLILHLLLYAIGWISIGNLDFRYYSNFDNPTVIFFCILGGVVIVLLWLSRYMRNNPFNAIYPLKTGRMFLEFCLGFVVFFLSTTMSLTFGKGRFDHMSLKTKNIDEVQYANITYTAYHLIAFNYDDFRESRDCSKQDNDQEMCAQDAIDTFDIEGNRVETAEEISYLHYCDDNNLTYDNLVDKGEIDKKVKGWLKAGDKVSVKKALEDYLTLCKKYGAGFNFNVDRQVASIFSTPNYKVLNITQQYASGDAEQYIETHKVESVISTVRDLDGRNGRGFLSNEEWLVWVYFALGCTVALFSLRGTKLRPWFMSIIGVIIWGILLSMFTALSLLGNSNGTMTGFACIALFFAWMLYSIVNIKSKMNKTSAGMALNWWLWALPAFLPGALLFLAVISNSRYVNGEYRENSYAAWVNDHVTALWAWNIPIVFFVVALLWIPLARKWQAMPEE